MMWEEGCGVPVDVDEEGADHPVDEGECDCGRCMDCLGMSWEDFR